MKLFVLNALAYGLLISSQVTFADDLYHCGNNYQDKPCRSSASNIDTTKKVSPPIKIQATNESQTTSVVDSNCQQHGQSAKAIAKLHEEGKTQEQQINATSDVKTQALIKDVYKHRGSAFQIQYAFEHECMQIIEKERLTKNQMAESQRLWNSGAKNSTPTKSQVAKTSIEKISQPNELSQVTLPSQASNQIHTEKNVPVAISTSTEPKAETAKLAEKSQDEGDEFGICKSFKAGIANIASQKLKGGDTAHMKDLNQQQVQLDHEMKSAGC